MDEGAATRRLADEGISSVQFLLASVLSLVLFLAFANVVVIQYGRGALRSALEQGARAGSLTGSTLACESTASDVLDQLLGGRMSDGVVLRCEPAGGLMVASGSAVFESWTPLAPDFSFSMTSEALVESAP